MNLVALDAVTCWQLTQSLWHTCWIGLVVGVLAAMANHWLSRAPAWQRYGLNMAALAVMGACLPVSFAVIRATNHGGDPLPAVVATDSVPQAVRSSNEAQVPRSRGSSASQVEPIETAAAIPESPALGDVNPVPQFATGLDSVVLPTTLSHFVQAAAPYITGIYLLGFYVMLAKLIVAIYGGKRLRAGCRPVEDRRLLDMLAWQSQRLALRLVPTVACCERVAVPVVVGVIRPMILLPASMLTGLTPDELGAVLTHELAHIRRYDHWLILVQRFLEAALFFHPVAWYLSRQIHAERERCCDDLVVAAGGDRLVYARSLLRVAELRLTGAPQRTHLAALAADGQHPSQLRQRIARLLGDAADPNVRFRNRWPALLLGIVCTAALWLVTAGTWQVLAQAKNEKLKSDEAEFTGFTVEPAEPREPPRDFDNADDDQAIRDNFQKNFIARFLNGIEVELAAVAPHALEAAEWRRPDGARIAPAESAEAERLWGNWPFEPRGREYRFLIRTRGLPATAGIQVDTSASSYRNAHDSLWRKSKGGQPDEWLTRATAAPLKDEQAAVSIRVRLTDGWGPVQAIDGEAKPIESAPVPDEHKSVYLSAKVRIDEDSEVVSRVKTTLQTNDACGVRISLPSDSAQGQIVAVDKDGREHTSQFSGTAFPDASDNKDGAFVVFAYFDMVRSRVSRFEYKLRSFRREVLFEGVSLRPDQVTNVRIRAKTLALAGAEKDKVNDAAPPETTLPQIAERGAKHFAAIKTAHIKFRSSTLGGPFKAGTTPARCRELLEKYDFIQHPDKLRYLVNEITDDDERRAGPPWSDCELHVAGSKVRVARRSMERAPDIEITDGQIAIRWGEANSQVNIDPAGQSQVHLMGLPDFWQPFRAAQGGNLDRLRVVRNGARVTLLFAENAQGHSGELVVDEITGFTLRTSSSHRDRGVVQQKQWLGWRTAAAGIPYPIVAVQFDYQAGQLTRASFRIVTEMRLNEPVPETIFQLGAPAGSGIFDSRNDAVISGGRINYDVFDVTSAEQLKEASKPLDPEPKTPQEKFAVAELQRLYALADDEVLKRIGPPYPASRKHLPKFLGERYMTARRDIRSDCIAWKDGKPGDSWPMAGGSYRLEHLIMHLLKLKPTEIEGDAALLMREIPGDFVHRVGAPADRLAESLAEIAGLEFQSPIRLTFRDVERPVYLARGELKVALPEGRKEIALNSGPYSGHHGEGIHFGNLVALLQDVGSYIHIPVINETKTSSDQLSWSSRWYDLSTTKPEKRFKPDPQLVLKQIAEQTGITFTQEYRTVRLLFVETDGL